MNAPSKIEAGDRGAMIFEMDCEDYFADPCPEPSLSNSGIGVLLKKSPLHFAWRHPRLLGGEEARTATAAMHRGSVVHRLALGAGKDYVVIDEDSYRTKAAQEARDEAEAAGKVPILALKFDEAKDQAKIVREHLDAVLMGEHFEPEVVIIWPIETRHGMIWARGMVDAWCPSLKMAVDLKTTTDASPDAATRRMVDGGYDTQDAWYSRGIGHVIGEPGRVRFVTLFCENDAPHASHAVTINEAWRTSAWDMCEEAASQFARCLKAGKWPGYPRDPQLLSPPDWLISQRMYRDWGSPALDDEPFTTTTDD